MVRQILERVAMAHAGRLRYELWRITTKPGFCLYAYQGEVEVSRKPVESERRGRIELEKKAEWHSA